MSNTSPQPTFNTKETLDLIERDYRDAPEMIRDNMLERIQQLRTALNTPVAKEGDEISVDVSTCDDDADRRIFATIQGRQEDDAAPNGQIWLAHMDQDNFELIGKDLAHGEVAQSDEHDETVCLIWFEDADAAPEIITNRAVAERRFEMISSSWNAHLFAKLKSNDRNDPYAGGNIKEAGAEYAVTPNIDNASQPSLSEELEPPAPVIPEGWTIESAPDGVSVLWPGNRGGVHIKTDDPNNSIAGDVLHDLAWALIHPSQQQGSFQQRVAPWLIQCFGEVVANDGKERNDRFLEEALELVQSLGYSAHEAHQLVDYVFGRAVGDPPQEIGGVMVTLAALCRAHGLDMAYCGDVELERVWGMVEKIRAKQAAKPVNSPLPE